MQEYLAGRGDSSLVETYCRLDKGRAFKLKSFHIPDLSKEIITTLLQAEGGAGILLYGKAGTGKTEFARAVIRDAGKQPIILQYGEDGSNAERLLALKVAVKTAAAQEGSVLIADEADIILNLAKHKEGLNKGWINDFLDGLEVKIIWITNRVFETEESTLRRFAYSVHFKGWSYHQRVGIWKTLKKGHPLSTWICTDLIKELAAKYPVETAGIRSALDTLKEIVPKKGADKARVKTVLSDLLARHAEVTGNDSRASKISPLSPRYDVSALNTDCDPDALVDGLKALTGGRQMAALAEGENMCLLFHGVPGTGKTEFAKFLASELRLNLLVKRASDLVSMWLGETEKNIRRAFDEGVRDNAVLFVDEADTFFTERATAHRSYEVGRTNEFLTQMENHKGVLVCCTNLLANLDKASLRRFQWKVEFRPLTYEGKITLYRKYFPGNLSPARKARLRRISGLTPGDFKAVWHRHRFADRMTLNPDTLIGELEREAEYKTGLIAERIGF
ncbi:AAA family ATPase [Planctomycetota bacterium]